MSIITFNVSGTVREALQSTLEKSEFFKTLLLNDHMQTRDAKGRIFLDESVSNFDLIMTLLRHPNMIDGQELTRARVLADYYMIPVDFPSTSLSLQTNSQYIEYQYEVSPSFCIRKGIILKDFIIIVKIGKYVSNVQINSRVYGQNEVMLLFDVKGKVYRANSNFHALNITSADNINITLNYQRGFRSAFVYAYSYYEN